jgi:alkane 1-monooxygenase
MVNRFYPLKYLFSFSALAFAYISFTYTGIGAYAVVLYAYAFIPLLELLLKPDERNLSVAEEEIVKQDKIYDWYLYVLIPIQYVLLLYFLYSMKDPALTWIDVVGRVLSMGILCAQAINIGHELGHRSDPTEQFLAKTILLTSLIMHFFIEHNRGHHKRVATDEDPASAKKGDNLYSFGLRSMVFSYISAWKLEEKRLKKWGRGPVSIYNEMILFTIIQLGFTGIIWIWFGGAITLAFIVAAFLGCGILEITNYIEHYGLRRKSTGDGAYEKVQTIHSWNSNHIIGRLMIFELSRHSDHHYKASRKYPILKHHDESPQMPTGYPGMMVLSLVPPLWFYVMDPLVDRVMVPNQ